MSGGGGLTWGVNPIIHGGNQHLIDFSIVPNLGFQNSGTNLGGIINPDLTLWVFDRKELHPLIVATLGTKDFCQSW